VDVEESSDSEEKEEQDMIRVEPMKYDPSLGTNTLVVSKLSRNTNWPSHLIARFTHKNKKLEFSSESSEIEYNSEPWASNFNC
jgi:hypothetical protein